MNLQSYIDTHMSIGFQLLNEYCGQLFQSLDCMKTIIDATNSTVLKLSSYSEIEPLDWKNILYWNDIIIIF